jgi:hypothetical protein
MEFHFTYNILKLGIYFDTATPKESLRKASEGQDLFFVFTVFIISNIDSPRYIDPKYDLAMISEFLNNGNCSIY